MDTATALKAVNFVKVGPCLYRYIPSGKYYARVKASGKEIRKCLGTVDRKYADRKLRQLRGDLDNQHPKRRCCIFACIDAYVYL